MRPTGGERHPSRDGLSLAAGVNSNLLTDEDAVDELSGNSVLNGIPVEVARAGSA